MTIVYVIQDMCLHTEYIELLRQELEASYPGFERTAHGLPLLDTFIQEFSRLTSVDSMNVRRCALQPFSLSNGTRASPSEWVCAPSGAINTSAEYYPSPEEFSGFWYVDPALRRSAAGASAPATTQPKPSELTDDDDIFHVADRPHALVGFPMASDAHVHFAQSLVDKEAEAAAEVDWREMLREADPDGRHLVAVVGLA
ncbi:cytochrome p450 [Hirsutella rhossiliensis]